MRRTPIPWAEGAGCLSAAEPPASNEKWKLALRGCLNLAVAGPDYWLLPNDDFADPIHTNPDGADVYTKRLAALVAPLLRQLP